MTDQPELTPENTFAAIKEDWKLGATRKFKQAMGNWYIAQLNIAEQRRFNGLPPTDSVIHVLDDNVRKNAENKVDGYEYVFEIVSVGEDCDLVTNEAGGITKVAPLVEVGDIVLAKGNVFKIHTEPVMYAMVRQNIVAIVRKHDEKPAR